MKITNKLGLPQPLVSAVTRDHTIKPKQYSVTALLKGISQAILERRHDEEIEQDVSDMVWLMFGSAVHKICEEAQETVNQIKETKIVLELPNGYKISGIQDLYDDETKKITDYKTASVWKVKFNDWDDYRKQCLMYCWLFQQIGFDAKNGEVIAFLKDWSKGKALDPSYPQLPVFVINFEFVDQDFIEIEKYIMERFTEIERCEQLPDEELPTCSPEERWHKDDTFAVMKEGRKTALKVCTSEEEAQEYIDNKGLDNKHYIELREGKDGRCEDYCNVNKWCPFYQKKLREVM